ncbi:MAG: hypothetical protein AAF663_11615 [Planctomycetota bacterium]
MAIAWREVDQHLRETNNQSPSSDELASMYLPVLEELDLTTRHQLYSMHRDGSPLRIESLRHIMDHPKKFSSEQSRSIRLRFANDVFDHHCDLNWYEPVWEGTPPKTHRLQSIVIYELIPDFCYFVESVEPSTCHQLLAYPPFYCTVRNTEMRVLPTWDYAHALEVETVGGCMHIEID